MPYETELYDTLEVKYDASTNEIKKAFRRLALIHHPDKGGDRMKYQQIFQAYEILSDSEKRSFYDRYGSLKSEILASRSEKTEEKIPPNPFEHLFEKHVFGLFNFAQRKMDEMFRKMPVMIRKFPMSLEDACQRKILLVKIQRRRICMCQIDKPRIRCLTCEGRGKIQGKVQGKSTKHILVMKKCFTCRGRGSHGRFCGKCDRGVVEAKKTFDIHLTPDMVAGRKSEFVFPEEGDQLPGSLAGDLLIRLELKEHPHFKVENNTLIYKRNTTLKEAICGYVFTITHPNGKKLKKEIKGIVQPREVKIIKKGGIMGGDFYLQHNVVFPTFLSQEKLEKLKDILS